MQLIKVAFGGFVFLQKRNRIRKMLKKVFYLLIVFGLIIACSSSDDGYNDDNNNNNNNFDREALLSNYADNIILPALLSFQTSISDLDIARASFIGEKNQNNLDILSDAWLEAYKDWQYVEMFNIGQAETQSIDASGFVVVFNRYPVTVSDIETGASTGNYDLNAIPYYDAQGFPALDFLIHGVADSDTSPLEKFTSNSNSDGYTTYLTNVLSKMSSTINSLVNDWQGTYRNEFVNNTSSSATGSFSKMVNDFIYYYEKGLRANKIGTPAGNFSTQPLPDRVEAFYKNDVSNELALLGLDAVQKVFNGQALVGSATSAQSFASYLDFLDSTDLKNDINSQFNVARQKIQTLNSSFSNQVESDNTQMTQAYDLLQQVVVLLKVDMASAFNVGIDFVDSDGD